MQTACARLASPAISRRWSGRTRCSRCCSSIQRCPFCRALACSLADGGAHLAGIAYGSVDFYNWLRDTDLVEFATTLETHGLPALIATPRLHSINSALEVDLFGQVNVEWKG